VEPRDQGNLQALVYDDVNGQFGTRGGVGLSTVRMVAARLSPRGPGLRERNVLVQREMESGRARLATITPIPIRRKRLRPGRRGSRRNHNWFRKKGSQLGVSYSQLARAAVENQTGYERILNILTAKLLNKQPCRQHHAGVLLMRRLQAEYDVFQFPDSASSRTNPKPS